MSIKADQARSFEFGRVVAGTAALAMRNFIPFFLLAAVFSGGPHGATLLLQYHYGSTNPDAFDATRFVIVSLGGAAVMIMSTSVLQGALTRAAIDDLSGRGVRLLAALGSGLRHFFPLIGLAIVSTIGIALASLFLIVPGILLMVWWLAATPALMVEKLSVFDALGRSADLTFGQRWAVFGALLLYAVLYFAVSSVTEVAGASLAHLPSVGIFPVANIALVAVVDTLLSMIATVGVAALYFELRRVKEGVDVTELSSVFD